MKHVWRLEAGRRASVAAAARGELEGARARRPPTGGPAHAGAASRLAPTKRGASPPLPHTRIQPRAKGAGSTGAGQLLSCANARAGRP